jgi:probable F420-dependent oxidoreductase
MKFGAYLIESPREAEERSAPIASPDFLAEYARHAEAVGFDSIWFPDHVVIPAEYESKYPYQQYEGGGFKRYPWDETAFPEPTALLAYVAAVTTRIKLRTGVIIITERNPVLFAKQIATIDALSGGRVELGIGLGWLKEEYEALGIPWEGRGRRCSEYMEAMRALWTQEEATYHGKTVSFDRIRCTPKPAQAGGIPLIIGGHSPASAKRAGRLADGFLPLGFEGGERDYLIDVMREAAREAGRDPGSIELSSGAGAPNYEVARAMEDAGFEHLFFTITAPTIEGAKAALEQAAEDVLRRFK